jgi:hypothetical protein
MENLIGEAARVKEHTMATGVYCMSSDEHRANAILTALRAAGFGSEISVLIGDHAESRDMSVKEDALRGAKLGSVAGAVIALTLPGIGEALVIGPLLAALAGAAAGGAVGGLAGGSGALGRLGLPEDVARRFKEGITKGEILIAVHTDDPAKRLTALAIFRDEGGEYIHETPYAA